jgi:hypothetical protein
MPAIISHFIDKKKTASAAFFYYGGVTGLLTGVAAGDGTAGHVYVLRNPTASGKTIRIARLRVRFNPTTAFGAAQALALALFKLTGYSAAHTGGTAITPAKRVTSSTVAAVGAARIGTTGALTAGTQTLAAQPITRFGSSHSTLPLLDQEYAPRDDHAIVLEPGEGLLLRNEIAMGASGVGVLSVEPEGWER